MQDRGFQSLWNIMRQEIITLDTSSTQLQDVLQVSNA